jgi:hypothetical protein
LFSKISIIFTERSLGENVLNKKPFSPWVIHSLLDSMLATNTGVPDAIASSMETETPSDEDAEIYKR